MSVALQTAGNGGLFGCSPRPGTVHAREMNAKPGQFGALLIVELGPTFERARRTLRARYPSNYRSPGISVEPKQPFP